MEKNMHTPFKALTPEKMLQLNVEEHARALTELWRTRGGHVYVQGATGTGKSTVARILATQLKADWFGYGLLSPEEYKAELDDILARLAASRKKTLILDGFFPQYAGSAFRALLSELSDKGVSLFIFSQESLSPKGNALPNGGELPTDAFEAIAEFRYGPGSRYPVTFHQVK